MHNKTGKVVFVKILFWIIILVFEINDGVYYLNVRQGMTVSIFM